MNPIFVRYVIHDVFVYYSSKFVPIARESHSYNKKYYIYKHKSGIFVAGLIFTTIQLVSFLSPNSSFFQREPDSGGRKRSCFKHRRSLTVIFRVCCCLTRDMHADYKSWSSLSKTSLSLTGLQFRNSYPFLPALYLQLQILLQRYFSCAHIFSDPASHYGSSGKDVNNEAPSSKITNRNQSITCLVLH